jgi:hypothetical protein
MIATCQPLNKLFLFLFSSQQIPATAGQERTIVQIRRKKKSWVFCPALKIFVQPQELWIGWIRIVVYYET